MNKRKCIRLSIEEKIEIIRLCEKENLTSILQPLGQGIIKCFKSNFMSKKLSDIIERIEGGSDVFESYKRLTIKDAIIFIHFAWQEISSTTIVNCFKHAMSDGQVDKKSLSDNQYEIDVYKQFIKKAEIPDPVDEYDFINLEFDENDITLLIGSEPETMPTSEYIQSDDDDQLEIVPRIVTREECYKAFQKIKDYYNQPGMFNTNAATGINEISKALKKQENINTLDTWLVKK